MSTTTHGTYNGPVPMPEIVERAFALAEVAGQDGEIPVGAVIVRPQGDTWTVLSEERNRIVERRDPSAHAELLALRAACAAAQTERLPGALLVTTLEPCLMCSGALLLARLEAVLFCARTESGVGLMDVLDWTPARSKGLNHNLLWQQLGEYEARSALLLRQFFAARRQDSATNDREQTRER